MWTWQMRTDGPVLGHRRGVAALDPGREVLGPQVGEREQQFPRSSLGSRTSVGRAASSAYSTSTTPSPVLPDPVMPTTTPWVVRSAASSSTALPSRLRDDGSIRSPR
jgi:hypothetical protein